MIQISTALSVHWMQEMNAGNECNKVHYFCTQVNKCVSQTIISNFALKFRYFPVNIFATNCGQLWNESSTSKQQLEQLSNF